MAVEFKSSMSKNELLEIAAEHGIEADDSMKKKRHSKTAGTGTRRRGRTGAARRRRNAPGG